MNQTDKNESIEMQIEHSSIELKVSKLVNSDFDFEILKIQYWSLIAFKFLISAFMLIIGAFLLVKQQLNLGQFIAAEIVILLILSAVEKLILNLEIVYNILTGFEKLNTISNKKTMLQLACLTIV